MQSGNQARLKSIQTQGQLADAFCESKDINLLVTSTKLQPLSYLSIQVVI